MNKGILIRNMSIHADDELHSFEHCDKRGYTCGVFDNTVIKKKPVRKHMLIYTEDKPYRCGTCGKSFSQKDTLGQHMLINSGDKPIAVKLVKNLLHIKVHLEFIR